VLCLQIGDFLGDIGRGPDEEAWYNRVRELYMSGSCGVLFGHWFYVEANVVVSYDFQDWTSPGYHSTSRFGTCSRMGASFYLEKHRKSTASLRFCCSS
jgi:hypothetical protein